MRQVSRLVFAVALGALAAGCSTTPDEAPQDADWTGAGDAYAAGDWTAAIERFQRFLANNPREPRRYEARIFIGRAQLALGRTTSALSSFDEVVAGDAPERLVAEAHAARGMAYHQLGMPERAESDFLRALSKGDSEIRRDDCLYFLGISRIRQGRWDEGIADLNLLLRETPDSAWAPRARALRGSTARSFTVQAGAFSQASGAQKQAAALRSRGIEPELVTEGTLTCVRFGQYGTWREAQAAAERVERETGVETAVIP